MVLFYLPVILGLSYSILFVEKINLIVWFQKDTISTF